MTDPNVILAENFDAMPDGDALPAGWWAEGGQRVWIQDGRLHIRANAPGEIAADRSNVKDFVATVWCGQPIQGDVKIEFDTCISASAQGHNNINFFYFYSDPSGKPLYETRHARANADYGLYHSLNGYITTFLLGKGNQIKYHEDGTAKARFRMRRCPGFKLIDETYAYHCRKDVVYHVTLTKRSGHIEYAVDGKVYAQADDPNPLESGLIGFRTFRTELWFDNLTVTAIK